MNRNFENQYTNNILNIQDQNADYQNNEDPMKIVDTSIIS